MARVTGIGGFFFGAREPEVLNRWYAERPLRGAGGRGQSHPALGAERGVDRAQPRRRLTFSPPRAG